MVVDYDGRILTQASPGPGERIVVAAINLEMLRAERKIRRAHQMMAHLRTECYPLYRRTFLSGLNVRELQDLNVSDLEQRIDEAKRAIGYLGRKERAPTPNIQQLLKTSGEDS